MAKTIETKNTQPKQRKVSHSNIKIILNWIFTISPSFGVVGKKKELINTLCKGMAWLSFQKIHSIVFSTRASAESSINRLLYDSLITVLYGRRVALKSDKTKLLTFGWQDREAVMKPINFVFSFFSFTYAFKNAKKTFPILRIY